MLTFEEALRTLLEKTPSPQTAELALEECLGLALAEDVNADLDLPPFDKSSMDGYALRTADLAGGTGSLRVSGVSAAGSAQPPPLEPGHAMQVMTGAPVPPGADAVQMVEKTRREGSQVSFLEPIQPGKNISPRGSEFRRGAVALAAGRVIGPPEIGVLATFGRARVRVARRLSAAIVSTGDELVDIENQPAFGQIRNSNSHMLWAQCAALGLETWRLPNVGDDPAEIRKTLQDGLRFDLLILSGGVSMGEFDYVHKALADFGVKIFFHKAAIKPGKPLIVGRLGERMVFGLPGNPVSSFVTFEIFVRPAVRKWMGFKDTSLPVIRARLATEQDQKPGRLFFKPAHTAWIGDCHVCEPIETKGSADIVAFSKANSLLLFPADRSQIQASEMVDVMMLRGGNS